ncbi:hypothetical protein ACJJTC_009887 [Scirpophaga incertulas]
MKEFNAFEKLFLELVGEFKTISSNKERLQEVLRTESTRAETAEAAREATERIVAEARSSATAATASATQAATALAHTQEELIGEQILAEFSSTSALNSLMCNNTNYYFMPPRALSSTLCGTRTDYLRTRDHFFMMAPAGHWVFQSQHPRSPEYTILTRRNVFPFSRRIMALISSGVTVTSFGGSFEVNVPEPILGTPDYVGPAKGGKRHPSILSRVTGSNVTAQFIIRSDRQRSILEDRCTEMSLHISSLEREVQQLRPFQNSHAALQKQYVDLQERIRQATEDARTESSRLEAELRRVERSASGGSELRERARLAAAAHARERKLAAAELHHVNRALLVANAETARLGSLVAELQDRISTQTCMSQCKSNDISETVKELRAALEAERAGSAKLERALAACIADNASLAASLHANGDASSSHPTSTPEPASTNISAIDSFLAD